MSYFLIGVAVLICIPVLLFVISLSISLIAPRHFTGKYALKREMKKRGYLINKVPDSFFEECVSYAEKTVWMYQMAGKSKVFINSQFMQTLEIIPPIMDLWLSNPDDSTFQNIGEQELPYREIFQKYDVQSFK